MRFRASEVAAAVGGELVGPDVEIDGARHDSREVVGGELFVPVAAERDGHDFIEAAVANGAPAYLTSRPLTTSVDAAAIRVIEPEAALTALGTAARDRLPDRVIGITGSVGKTSTKDLTAAALSVTYPHTAASLRSFNNELGVPLTLVNAADDAEAAVIEMGARGSGHIRILCEVARPTIAIVTTVELVHTELFGAIEQVALAKRELVEAVPAGGTVVLNSANRHVADMTSYAAGRVLTFGGAGADLQAEGIVLDDDLRPRFEMHTPWGTASVVLGVRGEHNVANGLAAAGAALAAGAPLEQVADGLGRAVLSPWRMELVTTPTGARVLNDAYNAGPASTAAALRSLAALEADRRVAVLGLMAELGAHEAGEHEAISALAAELGIRVVAVAAPYDGPSVEHVSTIDEALERLGPIGPGDAVLVKGSRVAGLERLAARLLAPPAGDQP